MELSVALFDWLVADAGAEWLERARETLDQGATTLQTLTILRRQLDSQQAAAVVDQVLLRRAAAEKFSRAEAMWFTRRGLEQASGEGLSRYKAGRFPADKPVADLCCGIGGDALGLALRGPCQVVDRDPLQVRIATANCLAYGATEVIGQVGDVCELDPQRIPWVHVDPDRRPAGQRTVKIEKFDPGLTELERWLPGTRGLAVKVAPASPIPVAWETRCERQWIGDLRECKQQVLWFGELARFPSQRGVAVIGKHDRVDEFQGCGAAPPIPRTIKPARIIVEPHPALRAAELSDHLAGAHGWDRLDRSRRFFSTELPFSSGLVSCFETLADLPAKTKDISALLRKLDAAKPQVKAAGVPDSVVQPLLSLPATGTRPIALIVTKIDDRWRCLVTQPAGNG